MSFLLSACELIRFGWRVFPLASFSKIPAISSKKGGQGCKDATDDEELLGTWDRRYPNANLGLACGQQSGVIVIDFDQRNGSDETIKLLASRRQYFPPTVEVRTWSGGTHLYYRWLPEIKNSKSKLGPGIDVKTTGGYVVAPPSRIKCSETGKTGKYEWVNSPLGGELPRLPQWAVVALKTNPEQKLINKKSDFKGDFSPVFRYIETAASGQRNNILYWAARKAAESGKDDGQTKSDLLQAAQNCGLDRIEAEKTIRSAYSKR